MQGITPCFPPVSLGGVYVPLPELRLRQGRQEGQEEASCLGPASSLAPVLTQGRASRGGLLRTLRLCGG